MELKRVVVTGMGALTPIGNDVSSFWAALLAGKNGAAPITRFDPMQFKTQFACEVRGFDALNYMDRREAHRMDLFSQFAVGACKEALDSAFPTWDGIDKKQVGVIWASGIGGLTTYEEEVETFVHSGFSSKLNPLFIPKMIIDIAAGWISMRYGLQGLNYGVVSACASSSHAIINAFTYLRLGKAKVIVTGGSEASVTRAGIGGFNAMRALSVRNDDPTTASRPFDKGRDGFVMGEGAASLVLEEYEHARARGAEIYAEVVGGGMSADAYHLTAPHPDGEGAYDAMAAALNDAQMDKESIDYINTHGTSTLIGDVAEVAAIQKLFGTQAYAMNISSTKSMTGHLLGAAGSLESIVCIQAMRHDMIPPTTNHFDLDTQLDARMNYTFATPQKRVVRATMSNSFGFGGHNATLVFKKFEP